MDRRKIQQPQMAIGKSGIAMATRKIQQSHRAAYLLSTPAS